MTLSDTQRQRIDTLLADCDRADRPGCALAVLRHGERIYGRGYGCASLSSGAPVTLETAFDLASESKQFTGEAVRLLLADGALSLETSIRVWLPELHASRDAVTIGDLVHHTSGLPDYYDRMDADGTLDRGLTTDQLYADLCTEAGLDFAPGACFGYSNSNYVLLALIVERASGHPFADIVEDRLLGPAGMAGSRVYRGADTPIPQRATGYVPDEDTGCRVREFPDVTVVGDGRVYATVADLCRWETRRERQPLRDRLVPGTLRDGTLRDGSPVHYAFGLDWGQFFQPYRGVTAVGHGGGCAGFQSIILRLLEVDTTVILLANTRAFACIPLAYRVADAVALEGAEPDSLRSMP